MNGRTRVKICGVSDPGTARVAAESGADFIGLVFYSGSHRYVSRDRAREIASAVRTFLPEGGEDHCESVGGTRPLVVGLFVNEPVGDILEAHEEIGLDIVQLSGSEPVEDMERLRAAGIPFIVTVRAGDGEGTEARRRFDLITAYEPFAVHFDTHVPGMWGGSGVVGDWDLARELAASYPLFLAGGLDPGNVKAAIDTVRPFAVDVSSGVETNRLKDHSKIRAFIAATGDGRQGYS